MGIWEEHDVWHLLSDRDEQVRPAAEALQVVLSRRLHIQDAQGEIKPLQESLSRPHEQDNRTVAYPRFMSVIMRDDVTAVFPIAFTGEHERTGPSESVVCKHGYS